MRRRVLGIVTAAGLVVGGIGVWFSTAGRPAATGWTAYAPLSAETAVIVVGPPAWSIVLVIVGTLAVASAVTLLLVERRGG